MLVSFLDLNNAIEDVGGTKIKLQFATLIQSESHKNKPDVTNMLMIGSLTKTRGRLDRFDYSWFRYLGDFREGLNSDKTDKSNDSFTIFIR